MKKGIIFDFDGVIIDSREVQKEALLGSYKKVVGDNKIPSYKEFFSHSGSSLKQIFMNMKLPLEMIIPYQEISRQNAHKIKLHKHMKVLLKKLKEEGYVCALCTGKERSRTLDLLDKLDLRDIFDAVVCSDDVKNPKPHPDSIYLAIEKLGKSIDRFIMVGDAINDVKCAENAQIPSIAVTWGEFTKEEFIAHTVETIVNTPVELYEKIKAIFDEKIEKKKYLVNDLVVREDFCNMKCTYCLTETSTFGEEKVKDYTKLKYEEGSDLKKNLNNMSKILRAKYDIAVLKISGGEILMVNNILEFIKEESKHYKVVQLLTNGTLLNKELIEGLSQIDNVCIQLSLDHHTVIGNAYRTKNEKLLNHILENIDYIVQCKIPLEINCVLTDQNTGIFKSFADYLLKYKEDKVVVTPFPVRGVQRDKYLPHLEQLASIRYIIAHYEEYKDIMAPKVYMEYLLDFLVNGKRKLGCWITACTMGSFDTGILTPCPNYWFNSMGNILEDEVFNVLDNIEEDKTKRVLLNTGHLLPACKLCFTPWDIFNLFIEGKISIEELCKIPVYSFPAVKEYILSIKKDIKID